MHARIDQLLSLRDGQAVDAAVALHVKECVSCAAEMHRLTQLTEGLRALPAMDAPVSSWRQIEARLAREPQGKRAWPLHRVAIAASVAVAATVIAVLLSQNHSRSSAPLAEQVAAPQPADDDVSELVDRSRELERLLHVLPERPAVEKVSMAATIDTLEQRIQWLDFQLSYAAEAQLDRQQARRLWGERVELMDSLVKVRYAEAQRFSF